MIPVRHLYFHIPFCPKICPYCSFFVEEGARNKNARFVHALLAEVDRWAEDDRVTLVPETIYFGGGTPTSLLIPELDLLLGGLRCRLDLSELREWSVEANPATVRPEKAELLNASGVTRMSLGVQSWDPAVLKLLGRVHSADQAERTWEVLRACHFSSLSLDLMFSVPGQSLESWSESLARTVAMGPDHVSTYCLTYEEDTEFLRRLQSGAYCEDHERDARFYEMTQDALLSNGYAQYEVSNFARAGHESLHNSAYWDGADYLGFGPGAFSTLGLERWENVRDTKAYVEGMLSGTPVVNFRETLSEPVRTAEIMAFRMRTQRGVSTTAAAPYEAALRPYVEAGHVEKVGDVIRLTRSGILHADGVAELFIAEPEPR